MRSDSEFNPGRDSIPLGHSADPAPRTHLGAHVLAQRSHVGCTSSRGVLGSVISPPPKTDSALPMLLPCMPRSGDSCPAGVLAARKCFRPPSAHLCLLSVPGRSPVSDTRKMESRSLPLQSTAIANSGGQPVWAKRRPEGGPTLLPSVLFLRRTLTGRDRGTRRGWEDQNFRIPNRC